MKHDFEISELGLGTCKRCGAHMTNPQWPVECQKPQPTPQEDWEKEFKRLWPELYWASKEGDTIFGPITIVIRNHIRSLLTSRDNELRERIAELVQQLREGGNFGEFTKGLDTIFDKDHKKI